MAAPHGVVREGYKFDMRTKLIGLGVLATLAGCAGERDLTGGPALRVVSAEQFPAPTREDLILQQKSYVIGPMDKVSIDVYGLPDLSKTVTVDSNGTIALPLVGTILAAGRTGAELADAIAASLRSRYVRDPQVTVNTDTVGQVVTVDGQVQSPGLYPVQGKMTLIRAIAGARGLTQYARSSYVVVYRQVNKRNVATLFDLRSIRQGLYADPDIYGNDVIYVGESAGSRLFATAIQSGALLSAPLVAILN